MATQEVKRKLTAILSADVKGYSRLMGEDEKGTVRTLNAYKEAMTGLIQHHHGRVVDAPGDNVLAEFASVVDAVECAVEIQKELTTRNAELPENRKMEFRIGVNLGDVIEEEGRIYGDGVNIAARLESLSEAGGICISGTAFDQVKNKLTLGYKYLGEPAVRNIQEPVRVYQVLMEPEAVGKVIGEKKVKPKPRQRVGIGLAVTLIVVAAAVAVWKFYVRPTAPVEVASKEKMVFPLPDKPSIAVLPFTNMSNDPKQEYLADGISENIISALSQVPYLLVIARNSTFTYKGKPVKVQRVAEELGVRYVLEGSVQSSADTLRITAQLIDAVTGHHVWSERYDRKPKNLFALQDEIAMRVITSLEVKLTQGEKSRIFAKGTENLQAYLKYIQAREVFFTQTKDGYALARRLLEEALALDSQFPAAYSLMGSIHFMEASVGISKSPEESLKRAFELTHKSLTMDETRAGPHSQLGWLYVLQERDYDKGIAECERAIVLAPNSSTSHIWMGLVLTYAGKHEEAIRHIEQALRLDPIPPGWYYRNLGLAYTNGGRYDQAIAALKKSLNRTPNDILTHAALTAAYSLAGRDEEARAQAAEVLRINPYFSVEQRAKFSPYKNKADLDKYVEGLRKAGLPEKPSANISPSAEAAPKEKVPPQSPEKVTKPPAPKVEVASKKKMALPLPDVPSIAVLPFINMSGDPKQEFLSDGITEEIITALSKIHHLFVISRQSTFTYKSKPVKVRQVSEELGVRYVLEGSVQRSGDRIRINAQLIDALTGRHVWAERYDRDLIDLFAMQDDITLKILTAIRVKLTYGEEASSIGKYFKGKQGLDCYLKILEGSKYRSGHNIEDNKMAYRIAEEVIAMCPENPIVYVFMASVYQLEYWGGSGRPPRESIEKGIEMARKALAMDDSIAGAHSLLGQFHALKRDYEKAIAEGERAIALSPGGGFALMFYAMSLNYVGRSEEAIAIYQKFVRLNPFADTAYFINFATALRSAERYEEAVSAYKKSIAREPNNIYAHIGLASTYSLMGLEKEARTEAAEVLRINPNFSLDFWAKAIPFKDQSHTDKIINALRKAGLK